MIPAYVKCLNTGAFRKSILGTTRDGCNKIFLDITGNRICPKCEGKATLLFVPGTNRRMDFDTKTTEVMDRIAKADGIIVTTKELVRAAIQEAYRDGLKKASDYVSEEIGHEALAQEIASL